MASSGTGALRRLAPFLAVLGLLGAGGLTALALSGEDESPAVSSDLVTIQLEGDSAAALPESPDTGEAGNSAAPAAEGDQSNQADPGADRDPAAAHPTPAQDNPPKAATKLSRDVAAALPGAGGGQADSAPDPQAPAPAPAPAPVPAPQPPLHYQPYDGGWDDDWDDDDWDDDWDDDDWDDD